MMEIAGKTAFVTGAASGIGLGIATALSQAGVKVSSAISKTQRWSRR
jgi:NAD(P)-dependent dehydrogenase (short-subunit alcohol dehydrogenase family)